MIDSEFFALSAGMVTTSTAPGNTSCSVAIYTPGKIVTTHEHCAGEVRWEDGELQQAWDISYIGTIGSVERVERVWRRVPGNRS